MNTDLTEERHQEQKWFYQNGYRTGYRAGVEALQYALIKEYGDGWTVGEYEITKVADKLRK